MGTFEVIFFTEEDFGVMVEESEILPGKLDSIEHIVILLRNEKLRFALSAADSL